MKKIVIFLVFASITSTLSAQSAPQIKNLVFEAAGIRGIAYCGAIKEMESRQLLNKVEKVAGTSSGAIMALAISLGYSGTEIENLIGNTNFKKFNDGNFLGVLAERKNILAGTKEKSWKRVGRNDQKQNGECRYHF